METNKRLKSALALLITGLFLFPCLTSVQASTDGVPAEGIGGTVTDATTGDPLVGVTVTGGGATATTSTSGSYFLHISTYGTYTVTASGKNGFNQAQGSASINTRTGYGTCNLAMQHSSGIYGRVRSAESGNALLAGAKVWKYDWQSYVPGWYGYVSTDANGFYYVSLAGLPGSFTQDLIAESPGYLQGGSNPIAGYWAHHMSVYTNANAVNQYNFYLRRCSVADVVTSGVFINMSASGKDFSHVTAVNCQYLLSQSSTTSFGFSGSISNVMGFGYSATYTYSMVGGSGAGPCTLSTTTGNTLYTILTVELTGITEGNWGSDYHEVNRHVGQVLIEHHLCAIYQDPVSRDDSRYAINGEKATNSGSYPLVASESDTTVQSTTFSLKYTYAGTTAQLGVTTTAAHSDTATIQASPKTDSMSTQVYFRYFFETGNPGKGIYLHVCYDDYI